MPALSNTPLDRIDGAEVLRVLTPIWTIWTIRPATARRVRQRMRTIFRWAMAHGFTETNPAGEAIDGALPPMPKVKAHLRALPHQEVGEALRTVDGSQASIAARLCFRFLVLTTARPFGRGQGRHLGRDGRPWAGMADTTSPDEGWGGAPGTPELTGRRCAGGGIRLT